MLLAPDVFLGEGVKRCNFNDYRHQESGRRLTFKEVKEAPRSFVIPTVAEVSRIDKGGLRFHCSPLVRKAKQGEEMFCSNLLLLCGLRSCCPFQEPEFCLYGRV